MSRQTLTILAIDGGGIRGVIPAYFLEKLGQHTGKHIYQCFDIVAGTSTGSLLAIGLTAPVSSGSLEPRFPADQGIGIYRRYTPDIFGEARWKVTEMTDFAKKSLKNEPLYDNIGLINSLNDLFGYLLFKESLAKELIVASYEIGAHAPYVFRKSSVLENLQPDYLMLHAASASSSAPVFFEPYEVDVFDPVQRKDIRPMFVDGGVAANNPVMCAYWAALERLKRTGLEADVDLFIVSLGTGSAEIHRATPEKVRGGGVQSWLVPPQDQALIDVTFSGYNDLFHHQLEGSLNIKGPLERSYYRFDPPYSGDAIRLDDPTRIDDLVAIAETYYQEHQEDFLAVAKRLIERDPIENEDAFFIH